MSDECPSYSSGLRLPWYTVAFATGESCESDDTHEWFCTFHATSAGSAELLCQRVAAHGHSSEECPDPGPVRRSSLPRSAKRGGQLPRIVSPRAHPEICLVRPGFPDVHVQSHEYQDGHAVLPAPHPWYMGRFSQPSFFTKTTRNSEVSHFSQIFDWPTQSAWSSSTCGRGSRTPI